jgi:hypothetical protein
VHSQVKAILFLSQKHCALWICFWRSHNYSRFLSGNSEKSAGSSMKKVTWNGDCGKLVSASQ